MDFVLQDFANFGRNMDPLMDADGRFSENCIPSYSIATKNRWRWALIFRVNIAINVGSVWNFRDGFECVKLVVILHDANYLLSQIHTRKVFLGSEFKHQNHYDCWMFQFIQKPSTYGWWFRVVQKATYRVFQWLRRDLKDATLTQHSCVERSGIDGELFIVFFSNLNTIGG